MVLEGGEEKIEFAEKAKARLIKTQKIYPFFILLTVGGGIYFILQSFFVSLIVEIAFLFRVVGIAMILNGYVFVYLYLNKGKMIRSIDKEIEMWKKRLGTAKEYKKRLLKMVFAGILLGFIILACGIVIKIIFSCSTIIFVVINICGLSSIFASIFAYVFSIRYTPYYRNVL